MSNVCRYFLNNSCRYGNRCRFSHDVSDNGNLSSSPSNNPYVYVRDQKQSPQNWKRNLSHTEVREIIDKITEEAKQVEYENMWPLTCLSVLRDAPNVPGWEDYSMEEIRAAAYSAKAAGRFDEYVNFFMSLQRKAKENRMIFLHPGKKAEEIVRSMFEKRSNEMPQPPVKGSESNSPFNASKMPAFGGGPFSSAAPSPFGSPTSNTIMTGSSPFSAITPFSSEEPHAGIFAAAAQGFNRTNFNQSMSSNMNETAMETVTDVSVSQKDASPFHQNIFGQFSRPPPSREPGAPSVFATSAVPNGRSPFGGPSGDHSFYTPMDQLTEEELEQFRATTFSLDKLPLRPPPRELI